MSKGWSVFLVSLIGVLLSPRRANAAVVLNTNDISNFTLVGTQVPSTGPNVLTFDDASSADVSGLFAADPDAAPGAGELDLTVTFQVRSTSPANSDADFRVVMNDGASKAAIAACVVLVGQRGIGLAGPGSSQDAATYLAFYPIDWTQTPVTMRLRRTSDGGCELMEVNGAPPNPRVFLTGAQVAGRTRATPSAELGCFSAEGHANVEVTQFFTQKVAQPVAGTLTFTDFRIRDTDSADRLRFRADFQLGAGTNGIDPATEPVTIKLSVPGWEFYSQTLNGFTVRGTAPRRRWTLNDAERARTGIEQLVIDEDPNNTGGIFLRDVATELDDVYFGTVTAEIAIGTGALADRLTGSAQLVEKRFGSGNWQFYREP